MRILGSCLCGSPKILIYSKIGMESQSRKFSSFFIICRGLIKNTTAAVLISQFIITCPQEAPLCLGDFETLEIYSYQDWRQGCRVQHYWVELELDGIKLKGKGQLF